MLTKTKCLFFTQLFILFVRITATVSGGKTDILQCPLFCKCDSYRQLNRAKCSSKNLISSEVDLPNQVEILDLSYNDITLVDNKCFKNFSHLKYLNLSHNALHTLDWDAFAKLRRLIEIDLSYNRLEYVDERLFARNKFLTKVNLEGIKLESLQNKALLENPFIRELNLRNSQINSLTPQLFIGLSHLKSLDLSQNLLNNFNVEDFQYLPSLQELNLNENFIKCNEGIKIKLHQLKEKGINVLLDKCLRENDGNSKPQTPMLEKMIMPLRKNDENVYSTKTNPWRLNLDLEDEFMEEDIEQAPDDKESTPTSSKYDEWFRFTPDIILCGEENLVLCQHYRSCLQDLHKAWHEERVWREQCPINDVKFAFVMGIAIGVTVIVFILTCALCMKRCMEVKKSTEALVTENWEDLPSQPLARPTTQLPPQVRRQPRRRPARPARSLVRYEGPVAENFLSRLFGRPARHQYYRTINQNTATLIRRLSRSNLFNNRLSQHFVDRQTSSEPTSPDGQDIPSLAPRSETPPPSYGDVVVKS